MVGYRQFPAVLSCAMLLLSVSWARTQDVIKDRGANVQRIYAVADLVVPVNMDMTKPAAKEPATTEADIIRLIQTHIAPGTWAERGAGQMSYYPLTMSLVVTHTPAVHAEIHKLFTKLRRELDKEIAVEMRFVTISDATVERLRLTEELAKHFPAAAAPSTEAKSPAPWPLSRSLRLDDKQVLWLLEMIQGDRRSNVMQAPKITMFNGQKATISIADRLSYVSAYETQRDGDQVAVVPKSVGVMIGHQHTLQPVIEEDGKTVRLAVKLSISSLSGSVPLFPVVVETNDSTGKKSAVAKFVQQPNIASMDLETTLRIPDQQTQLVFIGSTLSETRNEYGLPVLSKIPYVNRLYRNVGYGRETQHLLVLITPRIVIAEQETAAK